jgi:hypothetical protein
MSENSALVEYIDDKINLILEYPQAWGGAESLEPLILMLLMLRQFAALGSDDERELMRAYRQYLAKAVGRGSVRLIERLPEESDVCTQAVAALAPFVVQQRARSEQLHLSAVSSKKAVGT